MKKKLAVFIDADNISYKAAPAIFASLERLGEASIQRVFGDWSSARLSGWKQLAHSHALQTVQQLAYTQKKNATDMRLVIEAMDLFEKSKFLEGFVIVSSDSDYTPLALYLRDNGLLCYGIGEEKTPIAFQKACTKFFFIKDLIAANQAKPTAPAAPQPVIYAHPELRSLPPQVYRALAESLQSWVKLDDLAAQWAAVLAPDLEYHGVFAALVKGALPLEYCLQYFPLDQETRGAVHYYRLKTTAHESLNALMLRAMNHCKNEEGWSLLAQIGTFLKEERPGFNPKDYGAANLSKLLAKVGVQFCSEKKYCRKIPYSLFQTWLKSFARQYCDKNGTCALETLQRATSFPWQDYGFAHFEDFLATVHGLELKDGRVRCPQ